MDDCISCGDKALYRCKPCTASFCEEHKGLHQRNKNKVHVFETIGIKLDPRQATKMLESLRLKFNACKEFKERMILETTALIRRIKQLCTNCLNIAESKAQSYMSLIEKIEDNIMLQDYNRLDSEIKICLSFTMPTQNYQEILNFYEYPFFQESPTVNTERLEELKSMTVDKIKQALAEEFKLFLEISTECVFCIAVTSDNKYIVSGLTDRTIRLWDIKDKRQECVLQGHSDSVRRIAVTKDNKYIVSASFDKTVRIWNLQQKVQIAILNGHTDRVFGIAVTSDNKYIASGSGDKTVRLWNLQNKCIYAVLESHSAAVYCIAITNDNRYVISGALDNTVIIWSIARKTPELTLGYHSSYVWCLAITSDNSNLFSGSGDKSIKIWNLRLKTLEGSLQGHTEAVRRIAVLSDDLHIVSA